MTTGRQHSIMHGIFLLVCCFVLFLEARADSTTDTSGTEHCPLECFHGGTCVHDYETAQFYCKCPNTDFQGGYTGIRCQTPFETCSDGSRCFNDGTCKSNGKCDCIAGFAGRTCDEYVGPCDPDEPADLLTEECRKSHKKFTNGQVFMIVAATFVGAGSIFFFGGRYCGKRSSRQDKSWHERDNSSHKMPAISESDSVNNNKEGKEGV